MSADSVLTPDEGTLGLAHAPAAPCLSISVCLGNDAGDGLDDVLSSLPHDGSIPVLLRITSNEPEFGADAAVLAPP